MAGDDQSDPFLWDEDRIVQELCTPNRSWKAPPAKKLPDPAALEAKLRDCGVDGETLLTYADEFDFPSLWAYLGIKKLPHQLSLKDAITHFRKRSPRYREWKLQQLANGQSSDDEGGDLAVKSESHDRADSELTAKADPDSAEIPSEETGGPRDAEPRFAPPELAVPCQGVQSPALPPSADPDRPTRSEPSGHQSREVQPPEHAVVQEPPSKKRRIAPTTISTEPSHAAPLSIPTEGDMFLRGLPDNFLHAGNSSGFLGLSSLRCDQLANLHVADPATLDEREFSWVRYQIPPGRRIQASAFMKRFFRSNGIKRVKVSGDQDEEPPLPVFGESDDESMDSETWREYEKEEQERLAMAARQEAEKERLLSKDQVREAIRNVIEDLESQWLAEKKPKYDRKAWRMWQDARRHGDRLARINFSKEFLRRLDARIASITNELLSVQWSVEEDVQRKASAYLEVSVFDKKYHAWCIDVLESPRQPPKPSALPRPTSKPVKPTVVNDDEEILTSDSDGMSDFIEDDDVVTPLPNDGMDIESDLLPPGQAADHAGRSRSQSTAPTDKADNGAPSANEDDSSVPPAQPTPTKIKSEEKPAPKTPHRITTTSAPEVIEIESSPSPQEKPKEVPGLDDLDSLEKIGEIGIDYWERTKDAKRLVVAILCMWSSSTRIASIAAAISNRDHNEIWDKYMWPTIEDPASAAVGSVEIDLARLFDAFISGTGKRIHKPAIRSLTCQRMKREEASFGRFCAFLRQVLPHFLGAAPETPTKIVLKTPSKGTLSQEPESEVRDPAEDLSSSASDGSASDAVPVPSSKKRRKRKRRDKNAQDLRIKSIRMNEELERRRRQLREKIAEEGSVPGDKTRLIVNETKESDDQALIYINDRIGSRIKDHQIEGVRFMWNQVVVDSSVRQGCLLAHTMGLGKTMQVITLLVVIAEASASPDPSVYSQIPENLRESKTLILCPPGLVDNWFEEIMIWAPEGVLGPVRKMESSLSPRERIQTVQDWASSGGVLILGYSMFTILVRGDEEMARLLHETPNLVVGDEAHMMKNPDSQRHQATANFKTMNRIAITGSPLTNNVMDYYAMINWVAPNYLADIAEFRERFANPIREGLYADSDPNQKRKARRMLHVLKETVAPKVHRRDIEVLFNELPTKREFIITLPLTKLQMRLYETYISWVTSPSVGEMMSGQARVWSLVAKLGLVLAHPIIFKAVAEAQKEKPASKASALESSKPGKAANTGDGDEDRIEMPQNVLIKLLATVAVREIEDYALSNKIVVLLRILDECKKVGDKVLVFSQSIPTLNYLENIFKRQRVVYQRLDGQTPMSERQSSIRKFNTDPNSEVYLISTRAGGLGLNIYGANRVVIFDFKYTPAEEQQAIGRAYRLGQTKPVYVYWLTIGGTFEDTIHNNAIFKAQLASRVVDKKNPDPWSTRFAEYFVMPTIPPQEDLSKAFGQDKVLDALLRSDEIGKLIRKITPTETFEREETYELSPEDQREAEQDIQLQRLRIQNPEEYRRREHERIWQSRTELGMPPPPLSQGPPAKQHSTNSELQAIPQNPSITSRHSRTINTKVPEHLSEKRDPKSTTIPLSGGSAAAGGFGHTASFPSQGPWQSNCAPPQQQQGLTWNTHPTPASQTPQLPHAVANYTAPMPGRVAAARPKDTAVEQPPVAPTQGHLNNNNNNSNNASPHGSTAAGLQPILGTGTHYKIPNLRPDFAQQNGQSNPAVQSPETTIVQAAGMGFDFAELFAHHQTLCRAGLRARYDPSELIKTVEAVLVEKETGRLPLMDKLQNVQKCSRNPRFAEAMLAGHVDPHQLASMTRLEMEELSASLDGMAEADFKQRVWTAKADLNVCNDTRSG